MKFFRTVMLSLIIGISHLLLCSGANAQDADIQAAQQFLSEQGYDTGPVDGFWGPRTEQAISDFQRNQGLEASGQLDEQTLQTIDRIVNPPPLSTSPDIEPTRNEETGGQAFLWWIAVFAVVVILLMFRKKRKNPEPSSSGKTKHEGISKSRLDHSQSPNARMDDPYQQNYVPADLSPAGRRKLEQFSTKSPEQTVGFGKRSQPNAKPLPDGKSSIQPTMKDGWIPKGQSIKLSGFEIGGMVYVGTPPLTGGRYYSEKARCFIDPSLPVAKTRRDYGGDGLSYWPSYSDITPSARATYLDWLSTGRNNPDVNLGYLFLYFYGLERRYFVDSPNTDEKREIVEEVRRLISIFPNNYSVENYLGTFLDVAEAISLPPLGTPPSSPLRKTYELSPKVAIGVGSHLLSHQSLDSEWLFFWFMNDAESRTRTPASRCENEFKHLFSILFDDRHPDGMAIKTPKRSLKVGYKAASSEFETEFELKDDDLALPIPDISTLRKPLQIAQEIADEAMDKLDSYSRFLGRSPEKKDTIEAHLLLPAELQGHNSSPEIEALKDWINESSNCPVSVTDLTQKIKGETPTSMTKKIWSELADSLGALNFSIAPDPVYSIRRLKIDDTAILFKTPNEGRLRTPSAEFESSLVNMAIASMIAHADGQLAEVEVDAMVQSIDRMTSLTRLEKDTLHANLKWFLANPPDLSLLRTHLKNAAPEAVNMIRQHAISITKADGLVHADEVRSLERIYKALGLDENQVYSDLHGEHGADEPLTVRTASTVSSGETIPPEPEKVAGFKLDHSRVSALSEETAKVKSTLTQIFETGDESETFDEEVSEDAEATTAQQFDGLSSKHAQFVRELIQTKFWSTEDFERLAQVHGLLPAGALESVNEWSFERFDDALIEEYEGFELNGEIVAQFKE